ncbi:SLC38A1 [Symbiodinium sp. CCMP2592]|nr:SLC38A1 [Symbiodinium sp. CCMP2592]
MKPVLVKLTGLRKNSVSPDASQQSNLELKAWVANIKVIWELRRVLAVLNPQRLKLDVKKVLHQSRKEWYILMRSYGLTEDEALFLNRASLAAQGKQPGPYTHEEHGVPTETVLAIAADGALYRKQSKEREHYQQFINSLVAAVLPADKQAVADAELEEVVASTRGCRNEPRCCHQATVMSISSDAKRLGNPAEEVTIFAAWSADGDCSAWLPPMVSKDFHAGPAVDADDVVQAYQENYAKHTERFFEQPLPEDSEMHKKRKALQPLKKALVPNKEQLVMLDKTLRKGVGWGLAVHELKAPLLINFVDQGSAAWPGRCHSLVEWLDVVHRRDNNVKLTFKQAGLNALKIEALLVLNLMAGPWQGAGNLGKLHGAMEQFLSTQSPEHPLFQACYPFLTETKHMNVFPFNYGSPEHQQEVWEWLRTLPIWFQKYEVVKTGRWHNFTAKSSRLEKYSGAVFFAILVFGFAEQWYKSIYDTPLGGASFSNIMVEDDDGDDDGNAAAASSSSKAPPHHDPAPAGMKQSEAQFQRTKLSKKFKSNLQMCLWWLGDRQTKAFTEPDGVLNWHIQTSLGSFMTEYLSSVLETLCDAELLTRIGFSREALNGDAKEDEYLANTMTQLACKMYYQEWVCMQLYCHRPPYCFAKLISRKPEEARAALMEMKALWDQLTNAEAVALCDSWLKNFLESLLWPRSSFCREILISLAEMDFEELPSDVSDKLEKVFRSLATSRVCEQAFKCLTDDVRASTNSGQLTRMGRWNRLIHTSVLTENGRCQISPTISHVKPGADLKVNNSLSEASDKYCSLGAKFLKDMVSQKETFGVTSYNQGGLATLCLLSSRNFSAMRQGYLALLAMPGYLLWRPDLGQRAYWVVGTSIYGVLVVQLERFETETGPVFVLADRAAEHPQLLAITNPSGWKSCALKAVPPMLMPSSLHGRVGLRTDGLLKAAAKVGFPGMTLAQLVMLTDYLAVDKGTKPKLMVDYLFILCKFLIAELTTSEFQDILSKRGSQQKAPSFLDANSEIAAEGLDQQEMEELEDYIKESKAWKQPPKVAAKAKAKTTRKKAMPLLNKASLTLADVQGYIPEVAGCSLSRETTWHHRFKVCYPRDFPPFSFSCTYTAEKGSMRSAAIACIRWAWKEHEAATGTPCPYAMPDVQAVDDIDLTVDYHFHGRYFSGQSGSHGLDRQGLNTPLFVSGNRCGNLQDARLMAKGQTIVKPDSAPGSKNTHHKEHCGKRCGSLFVSLANLWGDKKASGAATFCIPLRQTPLPGFGRAQVGRQPPAADKARTALQNSVEEAEVVEESSSKATVLSTAVSLAKSMLGSGALSLSAGVAAFTNTSQGLLVATAIILGMTVLSAYTFQMVAEVSADTGADDLGAAWKTSFGKWAFLPRLAVGTLSGISCTVYAMILGDLLTQFVQSFLTAVPSLGALKLYCSRAPVLISLTVCVLLPMCLAEDFSSLAFTSMLGLAACVYLSAFCALRALDGSYLRGGKFFRAAPFAPMALISASHLSDAVNPRVLVFLSNISTAYMNHGMAPATYQELVQSGSSKKSNLRRYALAVTLAFIITGGVCTSLMAAGFFTFGANTQGLLLANYATRDLAASLGKMGVMISILCGFPLNFMLLKSEVVAMAKKKGFSMDKPAVRWLTVALLTVTTGLALVLKDLGKVQAVTGATMGSFIVFVAPALMSRGLRRQRGGKAPGRAVQEVVLVMCGFLLGSLGVFLSITRK